METVKRTVVDKEGKKRQSTEDFQVSETLLYDTKMVDTCPMCVYIYIYMSGPIEYTTPKVNPSVNNKLGNNMSM